MKYSPLAERSERRSKEEKKNKEITTIEQEYKKNYQKMEQVEQELMICR